MKLINPTDDELNACFAENVAGWRLLPRIFHNGQWRDVPTWVDGKFYDGKAIDYCAPGQWLGAHYPAYTKSANAVLPWLEKTGFWTSQYSEREFTVSDDHMDALSTNSSTADTFPKAAVLMLLRVRGIAVEFST